MIQTIPIGTASPFVAMVSAVTMDSAVAMDSVVATDSLPWIPLVTHALLLEVILPLLVLLLVQLEASQLPLVYLSPDPVDLHSSDLGPSNV